MIRNHTAGVPALAHRAAISFSAFASVEDPILIQWAAFRAPLVPVPHDSGNAGASASVELARTHRARSREGAPGSGGRFGFWRLVAGNNRELARSFLLYESVESAREHVERLQADHATLAVSVLRGGRGGSWGWVARHEDHAVMTSSRWYESASTAAAAAAGAISSFASAVVAAGADHRSPSGRFHRLPATASTVVADPTGHRGTAVNAAAPRDVVPG